MAAGPRKASFPQLAAMLQGDKAEKLRALKLYLESGENFEQCEATITVTKRRKDKLSHKRQWLTVRSMKEAGFSEP